MFLQCRTLLLTASVIVAGTPINLPDLIATNKIVGLPEAVPDNRDGILYKTYQPYLDVVNGCVPYPAVDADGNTNAGLTHWWGTPSSGCSDSIGQVYVRGMQHKNGHYALMYAWYMPKDIPSPASGHRHEWEGVILWLDSAKSTDPSNLISVCPSSHGKWACTKKFWARLTRPLIKYHGSWPNTHSMKLTNEVGQEQPLIAWESLPEKSRRALQDTDFKTGTVPLKDGTFERNINGAAA